MWNPLTLAFLVLVGVIYTVRFKFFQIRKFATWLKLTLGSLFEKSEAGANAISPLQAFATALSATIGIGNLVGVTTAILSGGPGAVFWMCVSAFFGMMTKYAEIVLSIHFRKKGADGEYIGGPMYYIKKGLGEKFHWFTIVFALAGTLSAIGAGNMTQINSIINLAETSLTNVNLLGPSTNGHFWVKLSIGIALGLILMLVIKGGVKRVGRVTAGIMPIIMVSIVLMCIVNICIYYENILPSFKLIFQSAFNFKSAAGGIFGYTLAQTIRYGIARGIFSNEAGLGSTAIGYASAETNNPVKEGFWGICEVFTDTVICIMVALVVLSSGLYIGAETNLNAAQLINGCFTKSFGVGGSIIFTIAVFFLAYSTTFSWYLYGKKCFEYCTRGKFIKLYGLIYCVCAAVSSVIDATLVWELSDIFNALMVIPNIIGLLSLVGIVVNLTKEYGSKF